MVVESSEIEALKLTAKAEQWMLSKLSASTFMWGMAPNKWWCGIEQGMLGSVRLQTVGFRQLVYAPFMTMQKLLTPDADPALSEEELFAKVLALTSDEAQSLVSSLGSEVWSATCGPGDFIVTPPGHILIERTLGSAAYGLKRSWTPCDVSGLQAVGAARFKKSKSSVMLTESIQKIAASRT